MFHLKKSLRNLKSELGWNNKCSQRHASDSNSSHTPSKWPERECCNETGGVRVGGSWLRTHTIWAPRMQWPPQRNHFFTCSGRSPSCLGNALLLLTRRKCGAFDAHPLPGHLKQMWTFQWTVGGCERQTSRCNYRKAHDIMWLEQRSEGVHLYSTVRFCCSFSQLPICQ